MATTDRPGVAVTYHTTWFEVLRVTIYLENIFAVYLSLEENAG
jgi:hypothetical protein